MRTRFWSTLSKRSAFCSAALTKFWLTFPALFYALIFYFAVLSVFSPHFALSIPLLLLCATTETKRLYLGFATFSVGYLFASTLVFLPPESVLEVKGNARLFITDITTDSRYGKSFYKLKASILEFVPDDGGFLVTNVPCQIVYSTKMNRPHAGYVYQVAGRLLKSESGWGFKVAEDQPWTIESSIFSFTEWRYRAKCAAKRFFATHFNPGSVRSFLEGVCIGEFHDVELQAQLKRFGLQHILVVSGFHFSLIAAILAGFLRLILPWRATVGILTACIAGYLLFVGPSASVIRAFIAIQLALWAKLCEKPSSGINALGVGLFVICLYDPLMVLSPGFQLSFLATWAILILHPIVQKKLFALFPKYQGEDLLAFSFTDQVLFMLSTFFLTSLSLVLAVSIFMLPMSLFVFGSFPLLGIFYNCFFPFCVSVSVTLLLFGILFCWLPFVASFFFFLSGALIELSLTLVQQAPSWVDITLYWDGLTTIVLVAYTTLISLCAVFYRYKAEQL